MSRLILLFAVPLLHACHMQSKQAVDGDSNVSFNADGHGKVSFNLPIGKGELNVPTSMMHNGSFEIDGVKMIPGSKINGVSMMAADKGATVNLGFTAPQPPAAARAYFVDQFKRQGVNAALASDTVSGTTKDGDPFTIQIGADGTGSKGMIAVQSKD